GQYFTNFDPSRSVIRAESIAAAAWWPRWISIDWGFEHPAAVYWHTSAPAVESRQRRLDGSHTHGYGCDLPAQNVEIPRAGVVDSANADGDWPKKTRVVTYREFVEQHVSPRELAPEIIARSRDREGKAEHIDTIYLSPDAFAHSTDESSIAERLGDALVAAGFPRPVPADNDRVSGWMLMYEMLEADEWQIADSCPELIRTLPELVRDTVNVEDIAKREGDDAADAARYGLKTRASGKIPKAPREQEIHARVTSDDPTIRAIQIQKANLDLRSVADRII